VIPARPGLLLLVSLAAPASFSAQEATGPFALAAEAPVDAATGFEEILLELRIGRFSNHTLRAFSDGAVALLPAIELFEIAEVEHAREPNGALVATLYPGNRVVRIDAVPGTASVDGKAVAVPDGWITGEGGGDIYVATPILERLLSLTIQTDWVSLTAIVTNPEALPIGRRLAREARWEALRREAGLGAAPPLLDPASSPLGGAVLDWGLSSDADDPRGSVAYSLGVAARVLEGGLRVTSRSLGPVSQGAHRVDATYQAVFHDTRWITQMRLGDGFTTGPRLRDVRGFYLTNAPYLRGSYFGTDAFSGRVGPGWEVELRQSGRTLDLLRADEQGAFALDIPLRYGENAVQVVAFGPHGEVVTTDRLLLLGGDRLPGGRFEWGLSGGLCRRADCAGSGNLDLRYGLSNRWSVRAGAEAFVRDSLSSLAQPYAGVTGMLGQSLEVSMEALQAGFLRAGATFAPSPRIRLRGAHTAFSTSLEDPVLHDARRRSTTETDLFVRPLPGHNRLFVRASLLRQVFQETADTRAQASLTIPFGNLGIESGLRRETLTADAGARAVDDYQFAALSGLLRLPGRKSLLVRAELEVLDAAAVERARGHLAYQLAQGVRLEVGASWQRTLGTAFTVSLSSYLPQLRNVTQLMARDGAPAQLTQFSQGTVHWNEATSQLSLAPGPGLERGGISGYVFVDENGNGDLDPGEKGLGGVRLVVGDRAVTTDARGRHTSWDLVPFEPVEIWADSTSIDDPTLVPARNAVRVTVPPASFRRVNVPVSPSREISGMVLRVDGGATSPLAYAHLELVDTRTGQVRPIRTFSDGAFYEAGVRPGSYVLRFAAGYLDQSGLIPEKVEVALEVGSGAATAAVDPIVLRVTSRGRR